ncbi:MAG: hypothetical protein AAFQ37_11050 [Bacteroidota bacterium]
MQFFVASIGISLGLFFSIVLFRFERKAPYANQYLALLLFFLSLRIGKSVFYNFVELPLWVKNVGLAANLVVGPMLWFYGKSLLQNAYQWNIRRSLHFLPAMIYVVGCRFIPNEQGNGWWLVTYSIVLLQAFIYVCLSLSLWKKEQKQQGVSRSWYLSLI